MPSNTLDHLIDELGGPSDVAEVSNTFLPKRCDLLQLTVCI